MLNGVLSMLGFTQNRGALLFAAIRDGNEDIVRQILNSVSKPLLEEIRDEEDAQPNLLILGMRSPAIVVALLEAYPHISWVDKNAAFLYAAENGHSQAIIELLTRCGDEISTNDKSSAFIYSAQGGHSQVIIELLTHCSGEISTNDKGWALKEAAKNGHSQLIVELITRCGDEITINNKNEAFQNAIRGNHPEVIIEFITRCGDEIYNYEKGLALQHAAENDHFQVLIELLTRCNAVISNNAKGGAFIKAANNGHSQVIIEILTRCEGELGIDAKEGALMGAAYNNHSQVIIELLDRYSDEISNYVKGVALQNAAHNGHFQVIELLAQCGGEITGEDKGEALTEAARNGHYQVIIELLTRYGDEISNYYKKETLQIAAQFGHPQVIIELLTRCYEISNYYKGEALQNGARFGHPQVIIELLTRCGDEISNVDKHSALRYAAQNGHLAALNSLLADASVEALATHNNNEALIDAQMRMNGDDEDRARYQPIVDRLMQIPAVAALAPQTNLAHIAQFAENSMQSLNSKEKDIVSHLKNHYKSIYEDKGFEVIRAEILSYLEEAYNKSPALDNGSPLPLEFSANLSKTALESYYNHLIHGAWRYLSDSNPWMAPNALYVHTFEDGSKVAIISDADKELMSYLWIALCDETVKLEEGFTVEGNKNVFVQNIGELNRSHNHDERAKNPLEQQAYEDEVPGIEVTRVDDNEADKPTCVYGVTKRLLETAYGHPRIKPLDPRLMQAWMESLLFGRKQKEEDLDNIVDRLDKLSLQELKKIQDNLNDAMMGEEFECHPTLQIPQVQLDAFIEKAKDWYGAEEITKERNPKLVINSAGSGFIAKEHNSYVDLIQFCANDPINCFATVLNTYLIKRIQELEKPDVEMENVNTFTPSYDDSSKKRDHDEEPQTQEKYRRLL